MAAGAPPRAPLRRRRLVALLLLLQHRPAAASTAAAAPPPPAGFCERGSTAAFASGRVCCRKSCEAGCRRACRKGATECCPAAIWAAETCGGARDVDCAARDGDAVKSVAAAARSSTDVDVVIAGDRVQALGLLACARSLFSAAKDPDRLKLHLIVDAAALDDVERALKCLFAVDGAVDGERRRFTVYPFDLAIASGIKHPAIRASAGLKGNLAAGPNFARFYLGAILPKEVRKVVYLDADTVVLRDVAQLYDTALTDETPSSQAVAAVARPTKTVCGSFVNCRSADVARLLASQGISDPEKQLDAFNAGVMVLHLGRWEALGLTGKVEFWINWNADLPLYKLGSNPPLVLAVRGAFQPVDEIWNCQRGHACWPTAAVKHWSGAKKPWWLDADRDRTEWLVHLQGPDANASRRCLDVGGLPRLGERPAVAPDRDRNATQRSTRPAKGDRAAADARQMDAAKRLAALAADAPGLKAPELRINSAARDAAVSRALDASLAAAGKTAGPRGLLRALRRLLDGVGCGYVGVAILRGVLHVETAHYGRGRRCGLVPPDAVVDALGFLDEAVLRNAAARPVADAFFVLCANQRGISESERGIFETEKGLPIFTFVKRAGHAAPGILVPGPRQMTQAGGPGNDHDRKQDGDRRASVVDICRKWQRRFEDLTAPSARLGEEPSASVDAEWHAREGRVFWRGRIEPGYDCGDDATWARLEAAALTLSHPGAVDARLTHKVDPDKAAVKGCRGRADEETESSRHLKHVIFGKSSVARPNVYALRAYMGSKYALVLPEKSGTPGAMAASLWGVGAAMLLWETETVEWFEPALENGRTHLVVNARTLPYIADVLKLNDTAAVYLAWAARRVFTRYLCPDCAAAQWVKTVDRYRTAFGFESDVSALLADESFTLASRRAGGAANETQCDAGPCFYALGATWTPAPRGRPRRRALRSHKHV